MTPIGLNFIAVAAMIAMAVALGSLLACSVDGFAPTPMQRRIFEEQNNFSLKGSLLDYTGSNEGAPAPHASRRRELVQGAAAMAFAGMLSSSSPLISNADSSIPDRLDVNDFLRTGQVANPMGVSGQAGKSRPETGVVLRDGSEVSRDPRSGDVFAEIVIGSQSKDPKAVLTSFSSPWPVAKGTVFDVECRDASTGDGAFLSVLGKAGGKSIAELPSSFFVDGLFKKTGRFSFYGTPTDIKVKTSRLDGQYRYLELTFSNLSQATQAEIPRQAVVAATIPAGSDDSVVTLVGSATAARWKRGSGEAVRRTVESFRAVAAPKSSLKIRGQERTNTNG